MIAAHARLKLLTLLVSTSMTAGCESGLKIGSWALIGPRAPVPATRIEVTRKYLRNAEPMHSPSQRQKLVVDLVTGRTLLTDVDGQEHQLQLEPGLTTRLRERVADRSRSDTHARPLSSAKHSWGYQMVVYIGEKRYGRTWRWHDPAAKLLSAPLNDVIAAFDRAVRHVHPLSDSVNLID